jgi:hypothetical protein
MRVVVVGVVPVGEGAEPMGVLDASVLLGVPL